MEARPAANAGQPRTPSPDANALLPSTPRRFERHAAGIVRALSSC